MTATPRIPRSTRGFSMILMLVTITLLGIFAVVSTRLIVATLRLYDEAGRAEGAAMMAEAALANLRRDVWGARRIDADGARSLTVETSDKTTVAWRVDADGTLVRKTSGATPGATPAAAPRRWAELGKRIAFESDGATVTVRGLDNGADRAGGLRLTSRVLAAAKAGAS